MRSTARKALPVHNAEELFSHILRPLQGARLHKIVVAPGSGELVVLPGVVDGQEGQVVPLGLVELGLPLIRQFRLLLKTKEEVRGERI